MKDTANKLAGSSVALHVMPVWAANVLFIQRGFIAGRQLVHNIIYLDSMSRLHAKSVVGRISLLALCDYLQAFPSVLHA